MRRGELESSGGRCITKRRTSVLLALLDVLSVPLTDTGAAGVSQDDTTSSFESLDLSIASDGGTNLLRSRSDSELALEGKPVVGGLLDDGGRTGHILVGGVGARADKSNLDLLWPVVSLGGLGQLRDRSGQIGGEGSVDVGLQFREVLQLN